MEISEESIKNRIIVLKTRWRRRNIADQDYNIDGWRIKGGIWELEMLLGKEPSDSDTW